MVLKLPAAPVVTVVIAVVVVVVIAVIVVPTLIIKRQVTFNIAQYTKLGLNVWRFSLLQKDH